MPKSKSLWKDPKAARISWNEQKTPNADSNGHSIRKGPDRKILLYPAESPISSHILPFLKLEGWQEDIWAAEDLPRFLHTNLFLDTAQQPNGSLDLRENVCALKL